MATGYIDSNGNRHIISGMVTGELLKYTMAEYTALTNKPIDWICTDYDATSEYGINDTEVKHGNTTVNAELNRIAPISLGSISSGVTKQLTIPDNIYSPNGMYLVSIHNNYGAGSVYILRVNGNNDTMFFATLSNSTYFTITAVDKKNFTISASGASANDVTIMTI